MIAAASVASASTVFSFTGVNYSPGPGSVPAQTVGGVSVTATAFWANVNNSGATVTGSSNDLASTWIGAASGFGLGVCNPNAQSTCGSSPTSQVNNYQGLDFVNFAFNTSVNLNSVYVQGFGNPESSSGWNDVDLSYTILTMAQEMALFSGTLQFSSLSFTTYNTNFYGNNSYTLSGAGQYVLIGAAVTPYWGDIASQATPDAFAIQTLTVTQATPEPGSFFLIVAGLVTTAFFGRRRLRAMLCNAR
jgi:hypothetical protein